MRYLKQMNEGIENTHKRLKKADGKSVRKIDESLKKKSGKRLNEYLDREVIHRVLTDEFGNEYKCMFSQSDYDDERYYFFIPLSDAGKKQAEKWAKNDEVELETQPVGQGFWVYQYSELPFTLKESLKKKSNRRLKEAKKTLDDLYSDSELEALWDAKFNELVPNQGKANDTVGEVMRCFAKLSHAYLQNGDMLAKGWANDSTYDAASDLYSALKKLNDKELSGIFDKIENTRSENAYDHYLAQFYQKFIDKYLKVNESLKKKSNSSTRRK